MMRYNYNIYFNFTAKRNSKLTYSHPQGVQAPQVNNQCFRFSKRKSG